MNLKQAIHYFQEAMNSEGISPEKGLGTEGFQFASTLMPVVNVDLIVINENKEFLLSWRDDSHSGTGWHIPGGCIRFMETAEERLQKTALTELGTSVETSLEPIKVFEIFSRAPREGIENQRERAHFITLSYLCKAPKGYVIPAEKSQPGIVGSLKWFSTLPENLLPVQDCYRKSWNVIKERIMED